jgi:hypothetical protein
MRRLAALVMLLSGCSDDASLQIEVTRPTEPRYQQLITKTVVTVYEPELSSLTCEAIEFGDVTEDLLLGATVAQQTLHADGRVDGTLDDISRVGRKLVVARLTTDTDVLIAAGCTEVGDLSGEVTVVVETEVAATVAVDTVSVDDPYAKQITVVDPLGDSMDAREVRWRVFGPAGSAPGSSTLAVVDPDAPTIWDPATPGCTDGRGIANMRMVPPAKVSGFAARFRVSWPSTPIALISGFVRPGVALQALTDLPASNRCAIRTAGEHRVVCVDNVSTTPRGHRFELAQGPLKHWNVIDRGTVNLTSRPAGVFSIEETNGKEIYALLANGNVQNLFGTTSLTPSNCTDCAIDSFRVVPACGDDGARLFMHSTTGKPIRVMPARGGQVVEFGLPAELEAAGVVVELNNVGCVTTIQPNGVEKDVQVVILDITSAEGAITRGLFRCGPARTCSVTLPFALAGVGFLKAGTATKPESQLVGTAFDIAGAELVGWVLRPTTSDTNTYLLIDRQRIVAAAPPDNILVGKLDGDAEPDLVWTIRGGRSTLMQVSYAHAIEDDSRLSALAPITSAIEEVALGDATGDGFDDVLGVAVGSFVVLPQNVEGPTVADRTDESTCAQ